MRSKINELKRMIVKAAAQAGEGHIASAFSILDILCVLYDRILEFDPRNHRSALRDRFILSKGHASLGLYAVLADKGFFKSSDITSFGKFESMFGGHPDRNKVPGVEASTGSLGHGFPMSVGVALGLRIKRSKGRVFTLIGDGESNEGSVWEAALLASHHKLSNLCCIVDYNHSTDRALLVEKLDEKFRAFGWETLVINGHDHKEICEALRKFPASKPLAIIAETVKGCGCKMMENNPAWHHKTPTKDELESILKELT
jgi:transketolase